MCIGGTVIGMMLIFTDKSRFKLPMADEQSFSRVILHLPAFYTDIVARQGDFSCIPHKLSYYPLSFLVIPYKMSTTEASQPRVFELQSRAQHADDTHEEPEGTSSQTLEPTDGGRYAWTVLLAGVTFEALFWGSFDFLLTQP